MDLFFTNFTNMSKGNITLFNSTEMKRSLKKEIEVDSSSMVADFLTCNLTTVFLPAIYIIIFILGLPTNAMAIWVFLFRMKKKKNPASILLANLALADLLFIIMLPLKIHYHFNNNNWIFGELLCKVLVGFFYGNMYCSTIFIAFISVQRYWAVTRPHSHKLTNQVAVCVCVCVWIVVWLLTIPLYLYDQTIQIIKLNITTCHDIIWIHEIHLLASYLLTMGIVGYVVPCVVCVVTYLLTCRALRRSVAHSCSSKKKKKAIILMVIVLVMFLVCFTPSNVTQIVQYSSVLAGFYYNSYYVYVVAQCLSSLNSCLDPFMYYFISSDFRNNMKNMLKCCSERSAQQVRVSLTPGKASSSLETTTPSTSTTTSKQDHQVDALLSRP
ncbi:proteinase-activated receptor 2-like [Astyanax mexicanus]|uniref:F2R like trypsin receptor 1 n=1 Tax=Astyanax mexicanus TaxID=7994 RepID=A0A8B9JJI4_ASTMX|nr:proteinase-activated receptor 2-like [Astyanax mexicanus]